MDAGAGSGNNLTRILADKFAISTLISRQAMLILINILHRYWAIVR
jgi:hypothetical protein